MNKREFLKILERGAGLLRRQMRMLILVVVWGPTFSPRAILGAIPERKVGDMRP